MHVDGWKDGAAMVITAPGAPADPRARPARTGPAQRRASASWEAPAVTVLPVRATAAAPQFHVDGWKDGAALVVTGPKAPPEPRARQARPGPARRKASARWEAPAVTALAVGAVEK
jgi:hypothetical protein